MAGFDNSDVTVENGSLSTLTSATAESTWTGTFTPDANIEDTSNVVTVAASYTDVAGNAGTGATSANYAIDTKAPTTCLGDDERQRAEDRRHLDGDDHLPESGDGLRQLPT